MANNANPNMEGFFTGAIENRLAMVPGAKKLADFGNISNEEAAYNSRVLASTVNGAGPVANPIRAPWSFTDFVFGTRSLTQSKTAAKVGTRKSRLN